MRINYFPNDHRKKILFMDDWKKRTPKKPAFASKQDGRGASTHEFTAYFLCLSSYYNSKKAFDPLSSAKPLAKY